MAGRETSHPVWRAIKLLLGFTMLVLGIVGLFVPVLQGVLFLIVALTLLGSEIRFVRRIQLQLSRRYPGPWREARKMRKRIESWFRKEEKENLR